MATAAGLLGSAALDGAGTVAILYTVPAGLKAAVTLSLCNASSGPVRSRAGYVTGANTTPVAGQWRLGGTVGKLVQSGETIEFTTMLGAGQKLGASADAVGINATVNGIVETL